MYFECEENEWQRKRDEIVDRLEKVWGWQNCIVLLYLHTTNISHFFDINLEEEEKWFLYYRAGAQLPFQVVTIYFTHIFIIRKTMSLAWIFSRHESWTFNPPATINQRINKLHVIKTCTILTYYQAWHHIPVIWTFLPSIFLKYFWKIIIVVLCRNYKCFTWPKMLAKWDLEYSKIECGFSALIWNFEVRWKDNMSPWIFSTLLQSAAVVSDDDIF